MTVEESLLEAWIVGTVSDIEDRGHMSCCLCLHLLKQRLEVDPLGLPELDLQQRSGIVPILKHLSAVFGQDLLNLMEEMLSPDIM